MVVTLGVNKAFNLANWSSIQKSMATIGVLACLAAVVDSYLPERILWYDDEGPKEYMAFAGVP